MAIFTIYSILFFLFYYTIFSIKRVSVHSKRRFFLLLSSVLIISLYLLYDPADFPDLPIYEDFFNSIVVNGEYNESADVLSFEKGYLVLNVLLRHISKDFNILILCLSVFIVYVLSNAINKYSALPWLSCILFLCITFYSTLYILRQAFAIFIVVHAFKYIIDRRFKTFLLYIIIAFLFHKSAIICLSLYFLYPIRINLKSLIVVIIVSAGLISFFSILAQSISFLIPDLSGYIVDEADNISVISLMIPFTSLLFSFIFLPKPLGRLVGPNQLFIWMGIVECIITVLSFVVVEFGQFYRLLLYFSVAKIFLLPNVICLIKDSLLRFLVCIIWIICWLLYLDVTSLYGFTF